MLDDDENDDDGWDVYNQLGAVCSCSSVGMVAESAVVAGNCTRVVFELSVDDVARKYDLVVRVVYDLFVAEMAPVEVFVGSGPWLPSMYRAASQK
jgi:hypothetical protein